MENKKDIGYLIYVKPNNNGIISMEVMKGFEHIALITLEDKINSNE